MKRMHLLEIHDHPWCPSLVRDHLTDLLRYYINRVDAFGIVVPRLLDAMAAVKSRTVVDLCSGGGGPWPSLLPHLQQPGSPVERVLLTDLYPNLPALRQVQALDPSRFAVEESPVDIMAVPRRLEGFRTQFNAFHHFRPEQAQAILQDAVDCDEGIAIFELPERTLRGIVGMALSSPVAAYWGPLLQSGLSPARWLLTYSLPVLPTVFTIDGVVSSLRAYTLEELRDLVGGLHAPAYRWDIGIEKKLPANVTYLIGYPSGGGRH